MRKSKVVLILSFLLLVGCASLVNYQPKDIKDTGTALLVLRNQINNNPTARGVFVDFANQRFIRLKGNVRGGKNTKIIPFITIGRVALHTKKGINIVTIYNTSSDIHHRLVFDKQSDATKLIDAIYTLKKNKTNQYQDYMLQISYSGEVEKIPARTREKKLNRQNQRLNENPITTKPKLQLLPTILQSRGSLNKKLFLMTENFTEYAIASYEISQASARTISHADDLRLTNLKDAVEPKYKKVKRSLRGKKLALSTLKDFYAYWMAAVDTIPRQDTETQIIYNKRITETLLKLNEKANRYFLELN